MTRRISISSFLNHDTSVGPGFSGSRTGQPFFTAHALIGFGRSFLPLPAGLSGWVKTASRENSFFFAKSERKGMAISSDPKKPILHGFEIIFYKLLLSRD